MAKRKTKEVIETKAEVAVEESVAKKEFSEFINRLKDTNPKAYLKNKTELENKLNQL
jgi:hypothetical protein